MHILFISNEYPLWASGGKGSFIQTIARGMVAAGHSCTVLGIGDERKELQLEDKGVQIIRLPKPYLPKAKYIENFWRIRRKIKEINSVNPIQIVETSELDCAYLNRETTYKKVIRLHGGHHFFATSENRDINPIKGKREKRSFKNADAFIAVSNFVKSHTSTYLDYNGKPVEIIKNPIDLNTFKPQSDITIDENNITFVGTICEKKGVRQLLKAFKILENKYPDLCLNLYGRDWYYKDGSSYTDEMKLQVENSNIIFHGEIPFTDIPKVYAKATLCVFPSLMETQGLVAPEAMAMGKTVVFSQTGPGKETIKHGINGFLCDPYKPEDIAQKIVEALHHTEKERIQNSAIAFAQKEFSLNQQLKRNIEFYKHIMEG